MRLCEINTLDMWNSHFNFYSVHVYDTVDIVFETVCILVCIHNIIDAHDTAVCRLYLLFPSRYEVLGKQYFMYICNNFLIVMYKW